MTHPDDDYESDEIADARAFAGRGGHGQPRMIDLLNRLWLYCPPKHLDRTVDYSDWSDLDGLVGSTAMRLDNPQAALRPNVVLSLCDNMLHRAALDLDGTAWAEDGVLCTSTANGERSWPELGTVELIPSTHNQHGYGQRAMTWGGYLDVLHEMRDAGALGKGWVSLSARRGFTLLRAPGVTKHDLPPRTTHSEEAF